MAKPTSMGGPAPLEDKALRKALMERGVTEEKLPAFLRNGVVKKSKKGPVGAIVVRNISGLEKNAALKVVKQFEENVGGKEEVADKLAVIPDLPEEARRLVDLIRLGSKKSLAHLMAEAGVEPISVMRHYAQGCMELSRIQSLIEAHRHQPRVVKEIFATALDELVCKTCVGSGMVKAHANYDKDNQTCPSCEGSGKSIVSEKHREWAMDRALEITQMRDKTPGVQVNVQQNTVHAGGGFLEKVLLSSDAILYPKRVDVVEAEVVPSRDSSSEPQ